MDVTGRMRIYGKTWFVLPRLGRGICCIKVMAKPGLKITKFEYQKSLDGLRLD